MYSTKKNIILRVILLKRDYSPERLNLVTSFIKYPEKELVVDKFPSNDCCLWPMAVASSQSTCQSPLTTSCHEVSHCAFGASTRTDGKKAQFGQFIFPQTKTRRRQQHHNHWHLNDSASSGSSSCAYAPDATGFPPLLELFFERKSSDLGTVPCLVWLMFCAKFSA